MNRMIKRLTALLLCLCLLLPAAAMAEEEAAHAVRFTLQADMEPSAYPEQDQELMEGLAELIDMISLEGTFQYDEDCIDLSAEVLLNGNENTRTDLRLFGCETLWGVQSSLLGAETVTFNLEALLEFCMKAYFHLDVPLQRLGLVVSPYVHTDGLRAIVSPWNKVMNAKEGSRTIPRKQVIELCEQLSQVGGDRGLTYWIMAVALESGYDQAIHDTLSILPQWADDFLGSKGITITVDGENEAWTTGGAALFTRTVEDGWTTLSLNLPATPDGYVISGFCTTQDDGVTYNADARLTVTREELSVLDLRLSVDDLPQVISTSGPFSLAYDVTGDAVPDGFHLHFEGENDNGSFTLRQVDSVTGQTMLSMTGTAELAEVTSPLNWGHWDIDGLNFFSVSDATLSTFISSVQGPLLRGMLPLLVEAPVKACQSLMDLVSDAGIFDVLTSSTTEIDMNDEEAFSGEGVWDEEGWDEEFFDEEFFDEESWDEEFFEDDSLYEDE